MSDDTYYFPPGRSLARRVHGERSVGLLYGQRALLIGALEPLTYTGTMVSTKSGEWPFTRLARTAKIQGVRERMRRGRNDAFFDVVSMGEHLRGGTVTPRLPAGVS
jgi:hypothetical protein